MSMRWLATLAGFAALSLLSWVFLTSSNPTNRVADLDSSPVSRPVESPAAARIDPLELATPSAADPGGRPSRESEIARFIEGRVVGDEGRPVPGAEVGLCLDSLRSWQHRDPDWSSDPVPIAQQFTDARGRFRFKAEGGRPYDVVARVGGSPPAHRLNCFAGTPLEIRLEIASTVSLLILDEETEAPLPDARIRLSRHTPFRIPQLRGRSDPAGLWQAEVLSGTYTCLVEALEHSGTYHQLAVSPGAQARLEVRLPRGQELRGLLVDDESGRPIAGGEIALSSSWENGVRTAADGSFVISEWDGSPWENLAARAESHGSGWRQIVDLGDPARLELRLPSASGVRGRIVDASRRPLEDVYVAAIPKAGGDALLTGTGWTSTRSDSTGRFELRNIRTDIPHLLFARQVGRATHLALLEDRDVGDVVLGAPSLLEGQVVDAAGHGLRGARARLQWLDAEDQEEWDSSFRTWRRRHAQADDEGRFGFADLAPGRYRLDVTVIGRTGPPSKEVELGANSVHRTELVVPAGHTLAGRVVDPSGEPVVNAYIGAHSKAYEHWHNLSVRTDAAGQFTLADLPSGAWSLIVNGSWDDREPDRYVAARKLELEIPVEGSQEFVLPFAAPVDVVVRDAQGRPSAKGLLRVFEAGGHRQITIGHLQPDGTAKLYLERDVPVEILVQPIHSGTPTPRQPAWPGRGDHLEFTLPK